MTTFWITEVVRVLSRTLSFILRLLAPAVVAVVGVITLSPAALMYSDNPVDHDSWEKFVLPLLPHVFTISLLLAVTYQSLRLLRMSLGPPVKTEPVPMDLRPPATMKPVLDREQVALHEAGHAVVAHHLGLGVEEIAITPHSGHVKTTWDMTRQSKESMACTLAGLINSPDLLHEIDADLSYTIRLAVQQQALTGQPVEVQIAEASSQARTVLRAAQHDIETIFDELTTGPRRKHLNRKWVQENLSEPMFASGKGSPTPTGSTKETPR